MIKKIFIFGIIAVILGITYIFYQVNFFKVNEVLIKSSKFHADESIRILQISDVHNKKFLNDNKRLYRKVKGLDFDFIVITGDLIDGKTRDFTYIYSFIDELIDINPNIYYVSGNHEWRTGMNEEFIGGLDDRHIKILNNEGIQITHNDKVINICGIDDPYTNHDNLDKALSNIKEGEYTILLSHSPNVIDKYETICADLILSGHTHGGQIRLPFIGAIVAPGQGYLPEYDKGIFSVNKDTLLYIDSGLGTSVLPIRFLNRSQISLIEIEGE